MRWVAVLAAAATASATLSPAAEAAFPGENGKIAFWSSQFASDGGFVAGTWTIEPDGGGEVLVIEGAENPAWSADGTKLAYVRRSGDGYDVHTANADGSGERRLTDDSVLNHAPTWSPDGNSIAWVTDRDGTRQVWVMAADGTGARQVTYLTGGMNAASPKWSPAGGEIAYSTFGGGSPGMRIVNVEGTDDRLVTPAGFEAQNPDWAPDASRLVFGSWAEHVGGALYTIRPDGTGMSRIPNLQGGSLGGADGMGIGGPSFSPDGTKLLYSYIVCFIGRCGEGIILAEADGSAIRTLTGGVRFESFGTGVWQPVIPNEPPDCSAVRPNPVTLWPPNKHFRTVTLAGATDPDGEKVTLRVTEVSHDEAGEPDSEQGPSPHQVLLRAERDPKGDGRVYTIAFEASDERGATCTGEATVTVPRHK